MTLAAAAAIAAAAGVAVVAAAFAVFALLAPHLGPAGAAAAVAALAAVLVAAAGLIASARAKSRHLQQQQAFADSSDMHGLLAKVMGMAKDRPLVAAGVALAAGVFALRNPAMIASLVRAFIDPAPDPHRKP